MEYNFQDMIDRIKTQKKLKGVTNKELSESSGVPYGTLNKILGAETRGMQHSVFYCFFTA